MSSTSTCFLAPVRGQQGVVLTPPLPALQLLIFFLVLGPESDIVDAKTETNDHEQGDAAEDQNQSVVILTQFLTCLLCVKLLAFVTTVSVYAVKASF
jgi:hypothetical protein